MLANYKRPQSKCPPNGLRGGELPCQRSHSTGLLIGEGFFSPLFLVTKKGGTFWPVIDLRSLDKHVENTHFQMEDVSCSRPVFCLKYRSKGFYQTLKLVAAYLCKQGVCMVLCLDHFLILGSSYQEIQRKTAMAVTLLENLGFTVNWEKSCLIPTLLTTFLGFVINSTVETLSPPGEKVVKVNSICKKAISTPTMPALQVASLLGTLESCCLAIW